jgi:hypothetical protein
MLYHDDGIKKSRHYLAGFYPLSLLSNLEAARGGL